MSLESLGLDFEWNQEQYNHNYNKHKVNFDEAKVVFNDRFAWIFDCEKQSENEHREIIIGHRNNRLLLVSYIENSDKIYIISVRLATCQEREDYEKKIMKKPSISYSLSPEGELLPEYRFDYQKAKPNRFAIARRYFVYIIESPSSDDLLDGRTEGRVLEEALKLAEIPHFYSLVTTEKTLNIALNERLEEAKQCLEHKQPFKPILHLSMHGNKQGVCLTDNTNFSWKQLKQILAPLNNDLQGKLLLCMSSCYGAFGIRMKLYDEANSPFGILVGNQKSVSWSNAAVAYITFYHLLFQGVPVEKCEKIIQEASNDPNFQLQSGDRIKKI